MRIVILGAGHMGSWLAKELSKEHEVFIYDVNQSKAKNVQAMCSIHILSEFTDLANVNPNLLINAVSLQNTIAAFDSILEFVPKSCLLVDVTSVKTGLPEYYKKCGYRFVSTHPMFGPTFANVTALSDENIVVIKESDQVGAKFFEEFSKKLGLNVFHYTFKEHDEMMAYSLTLPFASTLVFAACMESGAVPGTTFRKHKAIAKGLLSEDDHLLAEILFNSSSIKQLEKVTARIEFLKHVIRAKDFEEAKRFFDKLRKNVG